jgi:ABC-type nitrate/sulfonate/bicarbonate transport system ATPase subunit
MVKVEGLCFAYHKGAPIFQDFNWEIGRGERWSIIGPSGCGKTTLLYLLAGLRLPAAGHISIESNPNGQKAVTGVILQDYGLLPWATALENVALGLKIRHADKETTQRTTLKWMAALGIEAVARHYPAELSGGQRQRVAIARTMALDPALLLMDEPFSSLDTLTREGLLDLTLDLWRKGQPATMALVSHNIEEAVYWGNHILVLKPVTNTRPQIVENPGSGTPGYRNNREFTARCEQLRESLAVLMNGKNG